MSDALLVRSVPLGDADLVVGLFTEQRGLVSAIARGARRSSKRFAALEPMHRLRVAVDARAAELWTLAEAAIARPRLSLVGDLDRLDAAGKALRWIRRAAPPHTPEPALWAEVDGLLDRLDTIGDAVPPGARLAGAGLRLLVAIGWGLELERCVRCGRECEPNAAACVDPVAGGLVCRSCGGARTVLRADARTRIRAALAGADEALDAEATRKAQELVEATLAAHAGLDASG